MSETTNGQRAMLQELLELTQGIPKENGTVRILLCRLPWSHDSRALPASEAPHTGEPAQYRSSIVRCVWISGEAQILALQSVLLKKMLTTE